MSLYLRLFKVAQNVAKLHLLAAKKKKWMQDAIKKPGRLHKYFGIPEGEKIPAEKINGAIRRLKKKKTRTKAETSLLRALQLGKTLKKQ